jgi:hypothetical protein
MNGDDQQQYVNSLTGDDNAQHAQTAQVAASPAYTPASPSAQNQAPGAASPAPVQYPNPLNAKDDSTELLNIKQEALQELSPLISHLDQSPEDKFKTTMMLIQASDDQSLVREAYAAAKQIPDQKARAQALLDIVNEINYFTQHHNS